MDLSLEALPSTTAWVAIAQTNFDKIEDFVNMIKNPLTHSGEVLVLKETGEVLYIKY